MSDNIETNIVSRRRILFEAGQDTKQLLQPTKSPQKSPRQPKVNGLNLTPGHVASSPQQISYDVSLQRATDAKPDIIEVVSAPNLLLANSHNKSGTRLADDSDKEAFVFTDYSGCFTDDGSPLIEQPGLSVPLLKRDRQLHDAYTASSPQHDFSLASQHLLLQQRQLQQQIDQQQQHLHKLNITLQDTAISRGSSNGHDLALAVPSSSSGNLVNAPRAQLHQSQGARNMLSSSTSARLPMSPTANNHPSHSTLSFETGDAPKSPQLHPTNASQLEVFLLNIFNSASCSPRFDQYFLQEAMRHFLQFREASLKKMHSLEQENLSLKSQLGIGKDKLNFQQQPGGGELICDLERRLEAMKMSHDQQILDLQARAAVGRSIIFVIYTLYFTCLSEASRN